MIELSFASVSILFVALSHVYGTNVGAAMSLWLMAINCYGIEANNRETTREHRYSESDWKADAKKRRTTNSVHSI